MNFEMQQKVRFRHCDPAGIMFFPRYFEMINDCVESFFDEVLEYPFVTMHPDNGVPTAQIDTNFFAPSRQGDLLDFALTIDTVGNSSLAYQITVHCDKEQRLESTATLVHVDDTGKPSSWPDPVRRKLTAYMSSSE